MRSFVGKTLCRTVKAGVFENMEFDRCTFDNASVRNVTDPVNMPVLRNIVVKDAAHAACTLFGVIVENVVVNNLKTMTGMPLFCWACLFQHVELVGKITTIKINRCQFTTDVDPRRRKKAQAPWDAVTKKYYKSVDWALDLRQAQFTGDISLEAIPGSLIRRDEETQVLVTRQQLRDSNWRELDFGETALDIALEWFWDESLFDDVVLVAEKKRRDFKEKLKVLRRLRKEGIAT
jgi:hypothetical protein